MISLYRRHRTITQTSTMMMTLVTTLALATVTAAAPQQQQQSSPKPRPGFSVACQGARSLEAMTKTSEIVTEAVVVDVSPARDNVYAVTLQVKYLFKSKNILTLKTIRLFYFKKK